MTAIHSQHRFYAGDTWIINGTLLDANGQPLDLTGMALQWGLVDRNRAVALDDSKAEVFVVNQNQIRITVSSENTASVLPGSYFDALRVTGPSLVATVWVGPIVVEASPFAYEVEFGTIAAQETEGDVAAITGNVA